MVIGGMFPAVLVVGRRDMATNNSNGLSDEEIKDIREFYTDSNDHKLVTLKELLRELDSNDN